MKLYRVSEAFTTTFPPYTYALPGLPLGKVGILHSIGGVGKSFWAMQACFQASAAGSCDFEFKAISDNPAPVGGGVIYISFEDEWNDFGRRAKAFYQSWQDDADKAAWAKDLGDLFEFVFVDDAIVYLDQGTGEIAFTEAFGELGAYLREVKQSGYPINLIVFDTLSRLHHMDENSNRDMAALVSWFERLARDLSCAVLVLHHDNKASMNGMAKEETGNTAAIRGASALSSNVRWHASLRVMTKLEAKAYGIDEDDERKDYLRIELDKTSYSPPQPGAWLKRIEGGVLRAVNLVEQGGAGYDKASVIK